MFLLAVAVMPAISPAMAQTDPLPSWNDGAAKKAIIEFVQATTTQGSSKFVPPEARIATFDQDGTTWVEQPMYTQVMYCLERVAVLAKEKPELKEVEPFKTVLSGKREYAYGPKSKVGTFTDELMAEAKQKGWVVISMKNNWKRIFVWE
jgi:hypothetical protein